MKMTEKELQEIDTLYRLVPTDDRDEMYFENMHVYFKTSVCSVYMTHRTLKDNPFPQHMKFRYEQKGEQRNHSFTATGKNINEMDNEKCRYFSTKMNLLMYVIQWELKYQMDEDMQALKDDQPHLFI